MSLTFGRVPKPQMIVAICEKPYDGAGYDSCPPRKIVGACIHCWDGHLPGATEEAKIQWAHDFFSTGGQRALDALADFVITRGGTIGMLNDPYGTRRPWCNGWGSEGPGLEGDGIAFVQVYGAYGTNYNLAGIEHEAICGEALTQPQLEASAELHAWLFDHAKVPWDSFPVNPASGIVTNLWHSEFAQKDCPCQAIRNQTPALQERVIAILKQYQVSGAPIVIYPQGFDEALCHQWFGTKFGPAYEFDPRGSVSKVWLAERYMCALDNHFKDATTGREFFGFTNGKVIGRYKSGESFRTLDMEA